MKKPCSEMFCLRNQDITDAKAFFYLFFMSNSGYLGKEWQGKPAGYISYGGSNGSRSIDQIRQVATQLGLVDSNAVVEIRDIFARNRGETFEGNEFDDKALKSVFDKLVQYVSA